MSDNIKFDSSTGEVSNSSNRVIIGCGGCSEHNEEIELRDGGFLGDGICNWCEGNGLDSAHEDGVCRRCKGTGICPGCKGTGVVVK